MNKSSSIYERAKRVIPGGVNSPVRAFRSVGMDPIFIESGQGVYLKDVDGNEYIDYICSWGPLILGHSHPSLQEGIGQVFSRGTSYGVPCEIEVAMAEAIVDAYPSVDMVRMVNSGTEATMSALRVARAYTGRNKILKFEGCYHGHSDALLVKSGSGTLTYGVPTSPGVPEDVIKDTLIGRYNDIAGLQTIFDQHAHEIAAVILEPVAGNMGVVEATPDFMKALRAITNEQGTVLIFDEVITGFRLAYGGAQEIYDIEPDMTCFGKIIGGGLPVGAYGGRADIMAMVSPVGQVYQAGTLSGNPLAMHMGLKTLAILRDNPGLYDHMEAMAIRLAQGLSKIKDQYDLPVTVVRTKGMVCLFFAEGPFIAYDDVARCDTALYAQYFQGMLKAGILIPPAQFEGYFISAIHQAEHIDKTIEAAEKVLCDIFKV